MDLTVSMIKLFVQVIGMEVAHRAGTATSAEFDALWANVPAFRVDDYQEFSASIEIDRVGKDFRATLRGTGGAAALGWGSTEDEARASLARTVEFNIEHNGVAI